jgi:23S rRNA pseudouridine955/2504/2580 synthase
MQKIRIEDPSDANQRIDKFVRKYLPNAPLGGIFKWLRTGKVKVNKKRVEQNYRIQEGDTIELHIDEGELTEMRAKKSSIVSERGGLSSIHFPLSIIYEDESLVVVDKPAGVNVHP